MATAKKQLAKRSRYRILVGLNYPDPDSVGQEKRACVEGTCGAECPWGPGAPHPSIVDDLPDESVSALVAAGIIAQVPDEGS